MFETTADLSGITEDGPLYVKNILQNAKIEVDEQGTIAAAVTGNITLQYFYCNCFI